MSSVGRSSAARATCIMRVAALLCCLASAASVRPIEVPELAVCISGAVRSFATVPVLRGLKRLVLQNPGYSSAAFAALSYDTISPQLLEYNASLSKQLSLPIAVRRALSHLRPELQAVTFYNTTSAVERFRSCRPKDSGSPSTDVPALYGMQLCFSLVRQHETARGDERFDFILRVRPDHLFLQPLPAAIGVNVSSWPRTKLLTHGGDAASFAIVPSGPLAAVYFRSFTAASSCLFRERGGDERLPDAFAPSMQCANLDLWENFARCVVVSNLLYHGLPKLLDAPQRPALIARICNLNSTTREPAWPIWPMPPGETCITNLDSLKRPRVMATLRPASRKAAAADSSSWDLTLFVVVCGVLIAGYVFRERLREDALALGLLLREVSGPLLEQAREAAAPQIEALQRLAQPMIDAVRNRISPQRGPAYDIAAADDDE